MTFAIKPFVGIPIIVNHSRFFIGAIVSVVCEPITLRGFREWLRASLVLIEIGEAQFDGINIFEVIGVEIFAFAIGSKFLFCKTMPMPKGFMLVHNGVFCILNPIKIL
jgi:hypothetical protein